MTDPSDQPDQLDQAPDTASPDNPMSAGAPMGADGSATAQGEPAAGDAIARRLAEDVADATGLPVELRAGGVASFDPAAWPEMRIIDDPTGVGAAPPADWKARVDDWYAQGGSRKPGPATFAEHGIRDHGALSAFGRMWLIDKHTRALILERLDVDPWRVPANGLLEYDETHDEWRVELYTKAGVGGPVSRVIVRKYAGRRTPAWTDLSPYIDQDPRTRVFFGPAGPADPTPRDLDPRPDPYAVLVERHRRRAQERGAYARGGRINRWPTKPIRDDQVDSMAYALSTLATTVKPAGQFLRELSAQVAEMGAARMMRGYGRGA